MKQVWITKAGEPEVLQLREAPDPLPRSGEVRIRVEAIGVNFADLLGRAGVYADAPPIPYVPGYEVAGVVERVAQGVTNLREGEKVFALTRFGGYSEVVCVPYKQVFPRLEWMSAPDAAALPVNYLTAYLALVLMGALRPGNRVLIHSAAGGVGLAALDICRIVGAEAYGTAAPEKHDLLHQKGLLHPIDSRDADYELAARELLGGAGFHVVLDLLGGAHWRKNYRLLAPTGRLVHVGVSSMLPGKRRSLLRAARALLTTPFYTPLRLMSANKGVAGVNLGHLWEYPEMVREWMAQIIQWYDEALFRPTIDQTFPLAQAADAHHYLHARRNVGKLLLTP